MAPLGGSGDGGVAIEAIMTRWTSMWRRKRIPKRDHRMTRSGKGEDEIQYARAVGKAAAGIRTSEAALEASSGGSSTAAVDRAWVRRQQSMQWRWLLKLQVGQETDQLRPAEVRRAPSTGRD